MAELLKNLEAYGVSTSTGFLPATGPLECLPHSYYEPWESLARSLPRLIQDGVLRSRICVLPLLTTDFLDGVDQWQRAYVVLGYLCNAFIFCQSPPSERLPCFLAQPMLTVSAHLGLPSVPTYSGQTLWNYPLILGNQPSPLDQPRGQVSFTGSREESAFFYTSVAIEGCGAPLIPNLLTAIEAFRHDDTTLVTASLHKVESTLDEMTSLLPRLYDDCSPSFFYHTLRPYLEGTKDLQSVGLPHGIFFETTDGGSYQKYRGPSNAQSSLFPFIDIVLGVEHKGNGFLQEMRWYMPGTHRAFLDEVERIANIQPLVSVASIESPVYLAYKASLAALARFREKHIQVVARYIVIMANRRRDVEAAAREKITTAPVSISGAQGTGGTKPIEFLKSVRDDVLYAVKM